MASLYDLFKLATPPQPVNPYNSGRPVPQFVQPPAALPPYTPPRPSLRHPKPSKYRAAKQFGRMVLVPMPEHLVKDYQAGRPVRLDQNTAMNLAIQGAPAQMPATIVPAAAAPLPHPQSMAAQAAVPTVPPAVMAQMLPMAADVVQAQQRPMMMPRNLLPYGPVPFGARMPG